MKSDFLRAVGGNCRLFVATAAVSIISAAPVFAGGIIFVDADLTTGLNDGSSWDNAIQGEVGVRTALALAGVGDQVWVAAGTYKPTAGTSRTISHDLMSGVEVYGGFAGGEASLDKRDVEANETILSGDIGTASIADNSHHVVDGTGADATAVLDGFTITGGNANGSSAGDFDRGGGMIFLNGSAATIRNSRVIDNRCSFGGGAGYVRQSSPTFINVDFINNIGGAFGGAFDCFNNCNPVWEDCEFRGNTAGRAGALEFFSNCNPTVTNSLIIGNTATGADGGGAVFSAFTCNPNFRNVTITDNTANVNFGGILHVNGGLFTLRNSIVYGNQGPGGAMTVVQQFETGGGATAAVSFSDIQGGIAGPGNINADPLFADIASGDAHILSGSPVIDAGSNSSVPAGVTADLDGNDRFVDDPDTADTGQGSAPIVDMGCYEFQVEDEDILGDLDDDGVVGPADLAALLGSWGRCPGCPADLDGDGTVGPADLALLLGNWG